MPKLGGGGTSSKGGKTPPKTPPTDTSSGGNNFSPPKQVSVTPVGKPAPGRARENAQNTAQAAGASGAGSYSVNAGASRTPRTRSVGSQPGGGLGPSQAQFAKTQKRETQAANRAGGPSSKGVSSTGIRTGGRQRPGGAPRPTGGTGGGYDGTGRTAPAPGTGRIDLGGRPPGASGYNFREQHDFGGDRVTGDTSPTFSEGPGAGGGGGGGGAAGSNPLSAGGSLKGFDVEDAVQKFGAKSTKKQRLKDRGVVKTQRY